VILYGKLGSEEIWKFHIILKKLSDSNRIKYIFRHSYLDLSESPESRKLNLNGIVLIIILQKQFVIS
jgi:hypothetical protein